MRAAGSRAWPEDVLAAPEAEQVVDGVLAGALPEAVARSLIEHRVVERVVVEALASAELEGELVSVREADTRSGSSRRFSRARRSSGFWPTRWRASSRSTSPTGSCAARRSRSR